jgi:hypothetical protein
MRMRGRTCRLACAIVALLVVLQPTLRGEDSVAAARELYAGAAYEDALTLLDALADREVPVSQRQEIVFYRTLCLFALGRSGEAHQAIEALIAADPFYRVGADDAPPRVKSAFSAVRRRMLPAVLQQMYSEGKAAFDRKEFAAAAATFKSVLDGLADEDIVSVADEPPLSDLRTLVSGFHLLSTAAAAPPPVAAPPPAPAPPAGPVLYSADDPAVVPPVVVRQDMPIFRDKVVAPRTGLIEIIVNEAGLVESATMRVSVDAVFDRQVLSATKLWKHRPATLNGTPVRYVRRIPISLVPPAP